METIQANKLPNFTPRELDVIQLLAHFKTRKQISACLSITYDTVDSYMHSIFKKVGLHKQVELIAFANENGFGKDEVING